MASIPEPRIAGPGFWRAKGEAEVGSDMSTSSLDLISKSFPPLRRRKVTMSHKWSPSTGKDPSGIEKRRPLAPNPQLPLTKLQNKQINKKVTIFFASRFTLAIFPSNFCAILCSQDLRALGLGLRYIEPLSVAPLGVSYPQGMPPCPLKNH